MADNFDIRLLGYVGFEASERFLRALEDEIRVTRWDVSKESDITVDRPIGLKTGDAMRAELEKRSLITVVSAHAFPDDGGGFCGEDNDGTSDLPAKTIKSKSIGATSMLLIDACHLRDLAKELKRAAQPGSLIVGLHHDQGKDPFTWGRDSVTVLAAVIRELCYPRAKDLSPEAIAIAVEQCQGPDRGPQ